MLALFLSSLKLLELPTSSYFIDVHHDTIVQLLYNNDLHWYDPQVIPPIFSFSFIAPSSSSPWWGCPISWEQESLSLASFGSSSGCWELDSCWHPPVRVWRTCCQQIPIANSPCTEHFSTSFSDLLLVIMGRVSLFIWIKWLRVGCFVTSTSMAVIVVRYP